MGDIKAILSTSQKNKSYFSDDLRIEQAEWIHLHWRDVRILLTQDQFAFLRQNLINAFDVWNGKLSNVDMVLSTEKIPDDTIFRGAVSIEEQMNGDFHFHYHDMRIELSREQFIKIADQFVEARRKIDA